MIGFGPGYEWSPCNPSTLIEPTIPASNLDGYLADRSRLFKPVCSGYETPMPNAARKRAGTKHLGAVAFALSLLACGGTGASPSSPPNRCTSTLSSLQAFEPACWTSTIDAGTPHPIDAGMQ